MTTSSRNAPRGASGRIAPRLLTMIGHTTKTVITRRGEKTMSTIHNPTNFEPSDYEVEDYLDNKRPEYPGGPVEAWRVEIDVWESEMRTALGDDWRRKSHHCVHCGNSNIRWITAVRHHPTGDVVVFGSDCTHRLGFRDKHAFKLAQLQARDKKRAVKVKAVLERQRYLDEHPEIADAITAIDENRPEHAGNDFVRDVLRKLDRYGYLTERQAAAVVQSLERDRKWNAEREAREAERKAAGPAPTGKQTVTGTVLSIKDRATAWGVATKMTLRLENGSRVWLTMPAALSASVGDTVTVSATFRRSDGDATFAFGNRPHAV